MGVGISLSRVAPGRVSFFQSVNRSGSSAITRRPGGGWPGTLGDLAQRVKLLRVESWWRIGVSMSRPRVDDRANHHNWQTAPQRNNVLLQEVFSPASIGRVFFASQENKHEVDRRFDNGNCFDRKCGGT